jgi:predicted dinucleotide-binding enzyme
MKIGILGTGGVAQTLARRWSVSGHEITLGARDPASKEALGFPIASIEAVLASHDVVANATPAIFQVSRRATSRSVNSTSSATRTSPTPSGSAELA